MRLHSIEVAQRFDGKFNVWASVSHCELFNEKKEVPVDPLKWIVLHLGDKDNAVNYCVVRNLNYKLILKKL
jgi:hypothetical protein